MTLHALAGESGLSERFVADLERGRANISVLNLAEVAGALGVELPSLLAPPEGSGPEVIALLGLRGAGKTSVGRALARRLGAPFFELDRLVEAEAGMALAGVFDLHGEGYYRELEHAALERFFAGHRSGVLATGGGVVTSPEAFRLLRERSRTVWLKAAPEEHWHRVVKQGDLRPMADRPLAMAELRRRFREREPLYAEAELTVPTSGKGVEAVADAIARRLAP